MASGDQIKSLINAYYNRDDSRFRTVALQIAASEARAGHVALAREIKEIVEKNSSANNIVRIKNENPLVDFIMPDHKSQELVVSDEIRIRLEKILTEYRQRERLRSFGMKNRSKILVEGAPGTGKTLTASVIASELNLPLYIVQMDKIITKFMGETSAKLRQIFELISESRAVFLFDEFDAIGADRSLDNEVGEMRRVLNSFLQFLEHDDSDSIILAATNNHKMLDQALFRRFDDVMHYSLPDEKQIKKLFEIKFGEFYKSKSITKKVLEMANGLSHAEITKACEDCIKVIILENKTMSSELIANALAERTGAYVSKEA
ncbi:MAG: ATP-binding protein [Mobilitalea sp.]